MGDTGMLDRSIAGARVDDAVFALCPDYRAMLIAVDGLLAGTSDAPSEADDLRPARRIG